MKHVRIQSELLTKFWGRPMFLGANVLLPEGWDTHPQARYPLVINHGHFPYDFDGFRETPPDPDLKPVHSDRFNWPGYNRTEQEYAYQFYKDWTGRDFPRFLIVEIQHANPYYDDSYAVNSANLGPYGDAIVKELIPHHRDSASGASGRDGRGSCTAGSTGGWEAMGAQVLYPDEFNGAYIACPDPIDFRAYTTVNLYEDANAYDREGPWRKVARPGHRNYLGHVDTTIRDMNTLELVLGTQRAVRRPVGHLAGGLLAGRRQRLSEADLGQAHGRHRPRRGATTGAITTTCRTSCGATGRRSGRSCAGSSTSTWATWTITTSTTRSTSWRTS